MCVCVWPIEGVVKLARAAPKVPKANIIEKIKLKSDCCTTYKTKLKMCINIELNAQCQIMTYVNKSSIP